MWFEEVVRRAAGFGPAVAVVDERRSVSYEELCQRGAGLASGLLAKGVGPGDRVGILARNCVEVFETHLALALLGAVAIPLNHRLTNHELGGLATGLGLSAVLGEGELLGSVPVAPDRAWVLGDGDYERMAASPALAFEPRDPDEPGLGMLTSGTTSRPRCALTSRRALQACAMSWLATARPADDTVYFSCTPHFHSTLPIALAHLAIGARVVVVRDFSPQRALETIERQGVTRMYMVPSMLALTLRARGIASLDHSRLEEIFHGGAPISPRLAAAATEAFDAGLRDCYGQAQGGGPITLADPFEAAGREGGPAAPRSVGRPLLGVQLRIVDRLGAEVADGEVGEVCVSGDQLMGGYLDDPAASAEVLVDGWLRTGDLGCLGERGELFVVDRLADTIIRGGQNVYSAEVEQAILEFDAVEEVAVVGIGDQEWGEVPVAFVVPGPGADFEAAPLAAHCRERLAAYKRPVAYPVVERLPRNAAGKVRKASLSQFFDPAQIPVPGRR